VSIADLMKTANLTQGGFYGHFPARSALIAAALDRALSDGEAAALEASRS
jgi:TetR/AcrR family transcriptional repressor of nem operon